MALARIPVRTGEVKERKGCFWGIADISFIRELVSLSILVFEKFMFYKAEESLVTTILGVPKIRCIILSVLSLLKHYLPLHGSV